MSQHIVNRSFHLTTFKLLKNTSISQVREEIYLTPKEIKAQNHLIISLVFWKTYDFNQNTKIMTTFYPMLRHCFSRTKRLTKQKAMLTHPFKKIPKTQTLSCLFIAKSPYLVNIINKLI